MRELLDRIRSSGLAFAEDGRGFEVYPTAIPEESGAQLSRVLDEENAHWTLEIGFAYGISSLYFCEAVTRHGGGCHTAIDPLQQEAFHNVGLANIRRAGYEQVFRFFPSPSHDVLPVLLAAKERFQVIFIDGHHVFDYAMVDFFYADKIINVGGVIVLDDIWMSSIQQLFAFVTTNLPYRVERPNETGNLRLLRKCNNDHRPWDFHRRF